MLLHSHWGSQLFLLQYLSLKKKQMQASLLKTLDLKGVNYYILETMQFMLMIIVLLIISYTCKLTTDLLVATV